MLSTSYTTPPSSLVLIVDKLSSELFGLDEDELNIMIKDPNRSHKFIEVEPQYEENCPKKDKKVTTKFQLRYHDYLEEEIFSLTFFDQVVLSACMTEFFQKNTVITPNIIYRDLGGIKLHNFQLTEQFTQSLHKLSQLEIRLNAKDASRFLFHVKGTAFDEVRQGFVLPAEEKIVKLNGQICNAFQLTQLSVVFEYAKCKGHLVHIPIDHLIVPHTKNTLVFMLMKIYVYTRILRIIRKLVHTKSPSKQHPIVLETMYTVCGFTKQMKQRKFRMDLMKQLTKFMDYLQHKEIIYSYQLVDNNISPQNYLKDCTKILFQPVIKQN